MDQGLAEENLHGLVGKSAQIAAVRRLIGKAARNRLPVLLLGESGTGKEVVARAIYDASPRGRFVPIDCGSLVGALMESELFGHVRGAFSGAIDNKKGLVEIANGGTAFFDEIGDLPLEMQVKLLRLIQEREIRPVGATDWRKVDIRIIAATHRDLKAEVAAGRFRLDLFYRLNVFVIRLPPLRDRWEDIPVLVDHFRRLSEEAGLPPCGLTQEILDALVSYNWPGNVRELKNCVERMIATSTDDTLNIAQLPTAIWNHRTSSDLNRLSQAVVESSDPVEFRLVAPPRVIPMRETEKNAIVDALKVTGGERGRAAELLRISRTTLYRRMKQYGME